MFKVINHSRVLLLMVVLLVSVDAIAQNKLLLMNGFEITLRSFEEDLTTKTIRYTFEKKKLFKNEPKIVSDEIEMSRLFSLTLKDGKEQLYYQLDSAEGNFYSVERARLFVYGSRDAQKNYKPKASLIGGILFGMTGGLFSSFVTTSLISASSLIVPTVRTSRIGEDQVSASSLELDRSVVINADYRDGFQKIAKSKRVQKTLLGSIIGVGSGILVAAILKNNDIHLILNIDAKIRKGII